MNTFNSNIDISIVIVNYKSWSHLKNCLKSIELINLENLTLEVVIVDNCSNVNQFEIFKKDFSIFNFILNTGNNGFANGCNLGAKNANGKYLLFLNPDTIISENSLFKMFTSLSKNSNVGAVSCSQYNTNGSYEKNIRFFPNLSTLFGVFRAINKKIYKKRHKNNNVIYPDWVSGAVFFISRSWFDKINGWNEDFWMYFEDVDMSKKISNLGGKVALLTDTEIIHNHGGSSRINIKTASITKTEAIISKHVYISIHFKGLKHFILQSLLISNNLFSKLFLSFFGIIFFFIPKLRLELYLCFNIIKYYFVSIVNKTWLSFRSINYKKKQIGIKDKYYFNNYKSKILR
jgi:GT2 family glycosyltransferase